MAQLKMYWLPDTPIPAYTLPEGYSFSNYRTEADKTAWVACCKNGLVGDDADEGAFDGSITENENIDLYKDVFFLDHNGEHIGTVTAFVIKELGIGDVHMVAIRTDYRGKGLAKYLNYVAQEKLKADGVKYALLTTDEWRKGAVKGYLSANFLPVEYAMGMTDRWQAVLEEYGIDSVQMLYEDATPYKKVYRSSLAKKVKIGVFGAGRGITMMDYCVHSGSAELVAVCDRSEKRLNELSKYIGDTANIAMYTDFDSFLRHDMDCVVLANYGNEHAPYAIKCMLAGKHVLSEVLPVQNMKEAVELVEAVEKTGKIYAYAENCVYLPSASKMREYYRAGKLGELEYAEGEYMHNCEEIWDRCSFGDPDHWRNTMSAFYYCTHSLGPLIHITGLRPKQVVGVEGPFTPRMYRMGAKAGAYGLELVTMENGAVIKSLHGVGPSNNNLWYCIYGSEGRMESLREDAAKLGETRVYYNPAGSTKPAEEISTKDALTEKASASDHGGADYYTMYHLVEAIRGNRNAEIIDVYEALDMFLPGLFAYRSVLGGGTPEYVPDLRDKTTRDIWRRDTACTDPAAAGNMLQPSFSAGNPEIPDEVYEKLREQLSKY
ncbi:MAG: GNAT family N-acetyltransferase [Clostridia bacterium]|nr:GNAT family N-acetyltransferase [Clostridia bacterium]